MTSLTATPAQVAAKARAVLCVNRRGRVQHLVLDRTLRTTPTGQLRACAPVCKQPARRWYLQGARDPRPLCLRCRRWAARHFDLAALPYDLATPDEIYRALLTVTDHRELHLLVMAICSRPALLTHTVQAPEVQFGAPRTSPRRLTAFVPSARARCEALRRTS